MTDAAPPPDARTDSADPRPLTVKRAAVGTGTGGAVAIGALALGALAIGRLAVGRARVRRLHLDELTVDVLRLGRVEPID